ncbi:MAG: transcription factor FapR [Clostridia bacterium]
MSKTPEKRNLRRIEIVEFLKKNPYITDEKLAEKFQVSINTIRLDRQHLKIKECKERVKDLAKESSKLLTSISKDEIIGDLIELVPGVSGVARLETTKNMGFAKSKVVRGQYIYALSESLAIAVVKANAALVGIANIKYREKVETSEVVVAKAEVKKVRGSNYIVWIRIYNEKDVEVFSGKFILKAL